MAERLRVFIRKNLETKEQEKVLFKVPVLVDLPGFVNVTEQPDHSLLIVSKGQRIKIQSETFVLERRVASMTTLSPGDNPIQYSMDKRLRLLIRALQPNGQPGLPMVRISRGFPVSESVTMR